MRRTGSRRRRSGRERAPDAPRSLVVARSVCQRKRSTRSRRSTRPRRIGHTVHASSAEDALFRIELLARQSMHDSPSPIFAPTSRASSMSSWSCDGSALGCGSSASSPPRRVKRDGEYALTELFEAAWALTAPDLDPPRNLETLGAADSRLEAGRMRRGVDRRVRGSAGNGCAHPRSRAAEGGSGPRLEASVRGIVARRLEQSRDELAKARLALEPRTYVALQVAAPLVLGALVWSCRCRSPFWDWSSAFSRHTGTSLSDRLEQSAADDARGAAGDCQTGPPPAACIRTVRGRCRSGTYRWVKADFTSPRALLCERGAGRGTHRDPPAPGRSKPRSRLRRAHRLTRTHQPVSRRRSSWWLGEAARSNQRVARSAAAESRGLRVQAGSLPRHTRLFLYLLLANHALVAPARHQLWQVRAAAGRRVSRVRGCLAQLRVTRMEV